MRGNKAQNLFPSILLISCGLFYFSQAQGLLPVQFSTWSAIFILLGIAFILQSYLGKQYDFLIPASLFLGIGIHFHLSEKYPIPQDAFGLILLFLSLGFFLRYFKTKEGLFYGWSFLLLALIQLFQDKILVWFQFVVPGQKTITELWPLILIVFGCYLFFFKRK